jgi:hypothetical protein
MIKRYWFRALSVVTTLAASATIGSTAHASRLAQSLAACEGVTISQANGGNYGQWAVGNVIPASETAICPVDNVSGVTTTTVTVDVFKQAANAITVQACVTFAAGGGGTCGLTNSDPFSGLRSLTPPLDVWNAHPTDYRWLLITVNRAPSGDNTVFGYRQD